MKKSEFDEIIKQNLISVYGDIFGYVVPDNPKVYSFYYDKKQLNAFVADMREHYKSAYIAYGEGKGGELSEKKKEDMVRCRLRWRVWHHLQDFAI